MRFDLNSFLIGLVSGMTFTIIILALKFLK